MGADDPITDTNTNAIIDLIQAECTRRGFAATVIDVVDETEIDSDSFRNVSGAMWYDLNAINNDHCYCEGDGSIEGHSGCGAHAYVLQSVATEYEVGDIIEWDENVDLNDDAVALGAECACNTNVCSCEGACNCDSGNCSCVGDCVCEGACICDLDCLCDNDCTCNPYGCTCVSQCICAGSNCVCDPFNNGCSPFCMCDGVCSCNGLCGCNADGCTCVSYCNCELNCTEDVICGCDTHCICNNDCTCDTVCNCEFDDS